MAAAVQFERPSRWNHPLDPTMTDRDLEWVMKLEPFASMDPTFFSSSASILDILRHDARISRYESGDVIVREGDYGSCAHVVLRGHVRLLLTRLNIDDGDEPRQPHKSWWKAFRNSWRTHVVPEMRCIARGKEQKLIATRTIEDRPRIFIQDADAVLKGSESEPLGLGEIFGELAAMTRSPSHYSVVADGPVVLLEIRWQGLRLLRRDPTFQAQLDRRYREAGLKNHLRETSLFRYMPPEQLDKLAQATQLRSYGDMEWFADFEATKQREVQERIRDEPLIVEEGSPVNWLVLVRSGFARRSYRFGHGHRTVSYLGRGQFFGLDELIHNFHHGSDESRIVPYQQSLRGIGFVDALLVPRREFFEIALPYIRSAELPKVMLKPRYDAAGPVVESELIESSGSQSSDPALLEFLVDHRLMNGRQAMVIDTERCTRCDDCVRACAQNHDGNPRFIRHGPQFDRYQFTHSCMHCVDPVCMIGCPTGAIRRNAETGVVSVNAETCIGCKVCSESCPYENIVMVEVHDTRGRLLVDRESKLPILQATKCDLCQELPTGPACVAACPHEALIRVDLSQSAELQKWIQRKVA
jgi:Fe-S-cluster-containing dehydrogenase component/CRP-like cAMP-binding protein